MHANSDKLSSDDGLSQNADVLRTAIKQQHDRLWNGVAALIWKVRRPTRRTDLAEITSEVLADTVQQALSHAANYERNRPAVPWLMGIAVNVIRDRWRNERRDRRQIPVSAMSNEDWQTAFANLLADPADQATADCIDLHEAMGRLDSGRRRQHHRRRRRESA